MFNLKKYLQEANTFVSIFEDIGIVPMSKCDGKANLSGKTIDGSAMFSIMSKDDYSYEEFAFRDWKIISSILSTFKGIESFDIKIETREENGIDYPSRMIFTSDVVNVNHFLQRFPAIEKSPIILKQYKDRKIKMALPKINLIPITQESIADLNRVSSILPRKYFHIEQVDGDYYYCFGDMGSKSIDFAKVNMNLDINDKVDCGKYFPIGVYLSAIKSFDYKCIVGTASNYLFIAGESESTKIIIALAGKNSDA